MRKFSWNEYIGKGDAKCPSCGCTNGETAGFLLLTCGNCGYTGNLSKFVSPEKEKEIRQLFLKP